MYLFVCLFSLSVKKLTNRLTLNEPLNVKLASIVELIFRGAVSLFLISYVL